MPGVLTRLAQGVILAGLAWFLACFFHITGLLFIKLLLAC
ncbi:hypothetical protein DAQ1742_03733 [Dickeya aquatica]|uniref:Uncharacterized protein n=1 Tax=Dickeya aquatica TaxID=1401087 RepID=A0A375AEU8_9GAMM|nr:hypothetical protein DAQ1742_03733 [Dickeya aquatica]